MLNLFKSQSDSIFSNSKSLQNVISDIPKNDAVKSLEEIHDWLETLSSDQSLRPADRASSLTMLDDAARNFERKAARELFSSPLSAFSTQRISTLLKSFHQKLARSYYSVFNSVVCSEKSSGQIKPSASIIIGRGVFSIANEIKYSAFQYRAVPPDVASMLCIYFHQAESLGILDAPVNLYPGLDTISIRKLFATLFLWWASGVEAMEQQQMHISEMIVSHISSHLTLCDFQSDDSLFYFDISNPSPPMRVTKDSVGNSKARYIGLGSSVAPLDLLRQSLDKGIVPSGISSGISSGTTLSPDAVRETLRKLLSLWESKPPSRRGARVSVDVKMRVVQNLPSLIDQIGHGISFGDEETMQTWVAEDISVNGFKCIVKPSQCGDITVGSIVGFQPENITHWGCGITRRMRKTDQNNIDIGVELLSNRAEGVLLSESCSDNHSSECYHGILIPSGPTNKDIRVLAKSSIFSGQSTMSICDGDGYISLGIPTSCVNGYDYDIFTFNQASKLSP